MNEKITETKTEILPVLYEGLTMAEEYLHTADAKKRNLAQFMTSDSMSERVRSLMTSFADLRLNALGSSDLFKTFNEQYVGIWENMLEESTLNRFYEAIRNDVLEMDNATTSTDTRRQLSLDLAYFVTFKSAQVRNMSMGQLNSTFNADFSVIKLEDKRNEIQMKVEEKILLWNIPAIMGEADKLLQNDMVEVQNDLAVFLHDSVIDAQFIK
jgi:hypothetical protein